MRRHNLRIIPLLGALVATACGGDFFDSQCDLVTLNDSRCAITVVVDGRQAFTLPAGSDRTLDDIGPGRHVVEALDVGGAVLARRSIELSAGEDFYWTLDRCTSE